MDLICCTGAAAHHFTHFTVEALDLDAEMILLNINILD